MSVDDHFCEETLPRGSEFSATVVGCFYYGGVHGCHVGQRLKLVREPRNPYDANAIAVYFFSGRQVGHLQKETASWFSRELDSGVQTVVTVTGVDPGTGDATHRKSEHRPSRLYVKVERRAAPSAVVRSMDGPIQKPSVESPQSKPTSQPCFIVTAACGSEHAALVCFYRGWRDDTLSRCRGGLLFIDLYSRLGPLGASLLRRLPWLKRPVRWSLEALARLLRP